MAENSAHYTFLPWYRTGLASAVDVAAPGNRGRLTVQVKARLGAAEQSFPRDIDLLGPGDIIGIDPRSIVRLDPRPFTNDYEPNFLASIDFFDEDFVSRYSPRPPEGIGSTRLLPWLALIALEEGECTLKDQGEGLPRFVQVSDASLLPPPVDHWAWSHTHLSNFAVVPGAPASDTYNQLANHPETGCSRLLAARRLRPEKTYRAMVVPLFEAGRRAGLRATTPRDDPFAWGRQGAIELPVYFEWSFRTAPEGDFKTLALRLKARAADPSVGRRPMNMSLPLEGMDIPPILNTANPPAPLLDLEGALEVPKAQPSPWAQQSKDDFRKWLAGFINLGETWELDLAGQVAGGPQLPNGIKLPIVLPPSYGRWHANTATLEPAKADARWLEQLNLDPRNRVAAAFGTLVLQKNQEEYMARAWAQYGQLFEANRVRHRAQFYRELLTAVETKHLSPLPEAKLLTISSPAHTRVLADTAVRTTVRGVMDQSALPSIAVQPAMRRVLRQQGSVAQKFGIAVSPLQTLVRNVASTSVAISPVWSQPTARLSLSNRPAALDVPGQPSWIGSDWDLLRPQIVNYLDRTAELSPHFPQLLDSTRFLKDLLASGDVQSQTSASGLTQNAVLQVTSAAQWFPTVIPGGPPRVLRHEDLAPSQTDPKFSFIAFNFRQAALNAAEALTTVIAQPAPLPALDVTATAKTLRTKLTAYSTVLERVRNSLRLPGWVKLPAYDPLETIMAHPEFDDATYEKLKKISQDYVVPNLTKIANNTVTLLEVNWRFIESFLVGLNHEMSRELLWRGYPTDQRGSYFRMFWSIKGIPSAHDAAGHVVEKFRDIHPIHGWKLNGNLTPLGFNRPIGHPIENNLVLVVRGDLLRRYPNTIVYAVRAIPNDAPRPPHFPHITRRPDEGNPANVKTPIFEAKFEPDVYCFGFDLQEAEVHGNVPPERVNLGWYFVLAERFGEPRFGLNDPDPDPPAFPVAAVNSANDLTWAHLAPTDALAYAGLTSIDLSRHSPTMPVGGFGIDGGGVAQWNTHSADMATILLQTPYRVYFHANDLLKP
jgi:hypothetical protein